MKCPKCGYLHIDNDAASPDLQNCPKCGIVFEKYRQYLKKREATELQEETNEVKEENKNKIENIEQINNKYISKTLSSVIGSNDGNENTQEKTITINYKPYLVASICILSLLLAANIFTIYDNYSSKKKISLRSSEIKNVAFLQKNLMLGVYESYRSNAYGNYKVDRISEQQLIASEHTIEALQIIGIQNSTIIELLSEK